MIPNAKMWAMFSKSPVMQSLVAKDWRLYRTIVIALLIMNAASCIVVFSVVIFRGIGDNAFLAKVGASLIIAQYIAASLTCLLSSAIGGLSIAGERVEQTADFLALLPVTRGQIILSKGIVGISILTVCVAIQFAILAIGVFFLALGTVFDPMRYRPSNAELCSRFIVFVICWSGWTTSFVGIAWFLSTVLRSPSISACMSIAITIAIIVEIGLRLDAHRYPNWEVSLFMSVPLMVVGLLSAAGGAIYYRRRVAP